MIADFAVHQPDMKDGGISNPHFHPQLPSAPLRQMEVGGENNAAAIDWTRTETASKGN